MECKEFFTIHQDDPQKCKKLQDLEDHIPPHWETQGATPYSPGVVTNDEILIRQLFNPTHYDEATRQPRPSAFDDVSNKGLSVNRLAYTTLQAILDKGHEKAKRDSANLLRGPRELIGHCEFLTAHLRAIKDEQNRQAMAVYDTAKSDDVSHADVCLVRKGKLVSRSIRHRLWEIGCRQFTHLASHEAPQHGESSHN